MFLKHAIRADNMSERTSHVHSLGIGPVTHTHVYLVSVILITENVSLDLRYESQDLLSNTHPLPEIWHRGK